MLFVFSGLSQVKLRTITGKITDATTGESIVSASVNLKDSISAVLSDIDGKYKIDIPIGDQTIVISMVGYETMDIVVAANSNEVNVALKESASRLEEVVVVGYSIQRKQSMAGSVSILRSSEQKGESKKKGTTWKRSGLPENSIRLEVGDRTEDFLPLKAAQMAVQVDGFRVRVLLDCFFYNDKKEGLEGTFKLNLPTGASPYYFAFGETEYLNEDENVSAKNIKRIYPFANYNEDHFNLSPENIENETRDWEKVKAARIVSKQKAARAYEETVNNRIDPALMEWGGADMFSCRVFPLAKNKLHRIVIGYDLNMTEAWDFREFILTKPKTEESFKLDFDIAVSPTMPASISPDISLKKIKNRMFASLENPKQSEFTIRYNSVVPVILTDNENYFASNYRINLPEVKQENTPSDAVFLLDVSLSSQPDKFNVWLKLVEEILTKNTDIIKRFSVVCFNIDAFWWSNGYVKNNYYNTGKFLEYANTLALEGATDLAQALKEASHPSWLKTENKPKHLFLMSDADFNWGETNIHAIKGLVNNGDRIHTYKTGLSGSNSGGMDLLSKSTNGFSFTVTGEEEAELTAKSFRYRPWQIEDIIINGIKDFLISGEPSQLYNGQKLIFTGRGIPDGNIKIKVNNGVESRTLNIEASEKIESALAQRIYGQIALGTLENYSYLAEEATESYATYFKIPNATMSFLMLESEADYDRFGIDDSDAEDFVSDNTIENIVDKINKDNDIKALGVGKNQIEKWIKNLEKNSEIKFKGDSAFWSFFQNLSEKDLSVNLSTNYKIRYSEQQSSDEVAALANQQLRFDNLLGLSNQRRKQTGKDDALKLLSSVIEKNPGDFIALRDIAMQSINWGLGAQAYYMMRRLIANREYEAVAYLTAAEALSKSEHVDLALMYFSICISGNWDSDYGSFKEIAALNCLRFIDNLEKREIQKNRKNKITISNNTKNYINHLKSSAQSFLKANNLLINEADVVIIVNWNTNNTDVDLHVLEPGGEECYYSNRNTKNGGQLTIDVTSGYGPEMYVLRNAPDGKYKVSLDYYGDDDSKTSSKSKVYVDLYRNWGKANEKHIRKMVVLEKEDEKHNVLEFEVTKSNK